MVSHFPTPAERVFVVLSVMALVMFLYFFAFVVNSPGNIKKYEEQMAKEAAAHGHH